MEKSLQTEISGSPQWHDKFRTDSEDWVELGLESKKERGWAGQEERSTQKISGGPDKTAVGLIARFEN